MRRGLLTFCMAAIAGWWGMGMMRRPAPAESPSAEKAESPRSLLTDRGPSEEGEALPPSSEEASFDGARRFLHAVDGASASTLEGWVRQLLKEPVTSARRNRLDLLVRKLASIDPERAMDFVSEHSELTSFQSAVLSAWAIRDLPAAVAKAIELNPSGQLVNAIMSGIDVERAEVLYTLLLERGFDKTSSGYFQNLFSHLYASGAESVATRALDHAMSMSNDPWNIHGLENVLRSWSKDDPEGVIAWAEALESPGAKSIALRSLAVAWAERDPLESLQHLWHRLDAQGKSRMLNQFSNGADGAWDPAGVVEWVDEHIESPEEAGKILAKMVEGMRNSRHPERMAELIPHLDPSQREVPRAIQQAAQKWAEIDDEALSAWIERQTDTWIREAAQKGLVEHWSQNDPEKALAFLSSIDVEMWGDYSDGRRLIGNLFGKLGDAGGPEATLNRVPESMRDVALMSYAENFAKEDTAELIAFLEEQPQGENRDRALQYSVGHWAVTEPEKAAAWVDQLEEGESRKFAARNLANTWARFDVEGAMAWIETQEPSASRDEAAKELIRARLERHPQGALTLAESMMEGADRDRMIRDSLQALARRNPGQAQEALGRLSLAEKERERIAKMIVETEAVEEFFAPSS